MYSIKLVHADDTVEYFDCGHVVIKSVKPGSLAAREGLAPLGHTFELSTGVTVRLPEQGKSVFIVNAQGVTVDAYHWPPRDKQAGPRKV